MTRLRPLGRCKRVRAAFATVSVTVTVACSLACGAERSAPPAPLPSPTVELGTPLAVDELGRPRLLRGNSAPAPFAKTASEAARYHVARLAAAWGVRADRLPVLDELGSVRVLGGSIVRIQQVIDGLPVEGPLRVLTTDNGELLVASGTLFGTDAVAAPARFSDDDTSAIARAVRHAFGRDFDRSALGEQRVDRRRGERILAGVSKGTRVELARARKVWHPMGGSLVAAWVVEMYASTASTDDAFRTIIAADDGRLLEHRSLVVDAAFEYRVFADPVTRQPLDGPTADTVPHPTGTPDGSYPPYVGSTRVSVDGLNHPPNNALSDPWLPSNATETIGNNVDAYADLNMPTGLTFGDFRATLTGPRTFDRSYDTAIEPMASQSQQMAGVTSLFYVINWLHDFWYDAGFTEAAGNAQDNNYGRGGQDRDALLAEAQDNAPAGSRNNANMSTPGDGLPPRMQVYLWSGRLTKQLTLSPSGRTPLVGHANFGPPNFDTTGLVALANDGAGASHTDGCEAFSLPARIALVDRGNCNFTVKVGNAQAGGALGVIVANNVAGTEPQSPLGGTDPTLTIPTLSVTMDEGAAIKSDLQAGPVSARMQRTTGVEVEGSLDATLIAHEFGHYVHHRLSKCGTKLCNALSEGWGDFFALLVTVRPGDNLRGVYPFSVYTTQSFSSDPAYYGIRRVPYSADLAKNALSFRHMAEGEPLPTSHPLFPSAAGNSEVHNAGEVWASALWDGYVALQEAAAANGQSFAETHAKIAKYVVAGLMLTPPDATPTEARDAILAAVLSASKADHDVLATAFARRGLGSCAESPVPTSQDFAGIVESADFKGRAIPSIMTLDDSVVTCDDDGVLDHRETARLSFPLGNPGHADLANVAITVTSPTPGISILTPPIQIATLPAYSSTTIEVDISLASAAATPTAGELQIAIDAPGACTEQRTIALPLRLDVDDRPMSSTTERFDATSTWTIEGDVWRQVRETALDGYMHAPAPGAHADARLESPNLVVGSERFAMTFTHRYDFEITEEAFWDGGVVEYSLDEGLTWRDVNTLANVDPSYSGTISDRSNGPLGARMAYAGKNPSHPNADTVTIDFGTALANKTIRLRFRLGTDSAKGSLGWELDDVAFTGLANTPFPTQEADDAACAATGDAGVGSEGGEPPFDDGGCCGTTPMRGGQLVLSLGALAFVLRRRRR